MDEVFGRVGGKYKICLADSTMMWIVHVAMDKAHERAQRKEGVIECLTEISKFYELAVMQLEGCLKFVQEESDSSFESSDEEVIGDLAEIRDRLLGRLNDAQLAIAEKDRELAERLENELKLRKALETKQKELDSLRAKLKHELKKTEGVEELIIHGNKAGVDDLMVGADEERDEDISGLKNSVDQQVWNIKQKLEPETKFLDRRRNRSCDGLKIELMGIDIDILKETLDIAFGKMQSVLFSSEVEPVEQQWRWTIEKDVMSIVIKGFMGDIQESFQSEGRKQEKQVSFGWIKYLSDILKEIKYLHDGLQALCLSETNHESKISVKLTGRGSSDESNHGKTENSTYEQKQLDEEDPEESDCHLVAKLIKNHESIIKKKSKELNWAKREFHGEKVWPYPRGEEDPVSPRRRIQDVIVRMESLINQNENISKHFSHHESDGEEESYLIKRLYNLHERQEDQFLTDNSEDSQEKVHKISVSDKLNEAFHCEKKIVKEDEEGSSLQTMIMKKTCAALLKGLVSDSGNELRQHDMEILKGEGDREDTLKKMAKVWNEMMENDKIDVKIREQIHYMVFSEVVKDLCASINIALLECQNAGDESSCLADYNLEGKLREEISKVVFQELCKEWNDFIERSDTENLVREEIYQITSKGCFRDIAEATENVTTRFKEVILELKLREHVSRFLFGELCKEWKEIIERSDNENLVREEIYRIASKGCFRDVTETTDNVITRFKEVILEWKLREEVSRFLFGKSCKEWKEIIERSDNESLFREKIYQIALEETLRDVAYHSKQLVCKTNQVKKLENCIYGFPCCDESFQCLEHSIKEDVYKIFFREICREWKKEIDDYNFESLVKEEIFLLVVLESVKQVSATCKEAAHFNLEYFSSSFKSQEVIEEDISIQKQDSQRNCIKVEMDLIQTEMSETKNYFSPIQLKHEKLNMRKISRELLSEMGSTCASMSNKTLTALDHLAVSKALVSELRSCLAVAVEDAERFDDQIGSLASVSEMKPSWLQQKAIKEVKVIIPSYSAFTPIMEFMQNFVDFKCRVEAKLELNIIKFEGAIFQLNLLAELVAKQRRKELLYQKAFFSRCENLRKAETEVDLLGNQVEVLSALLQKIYNILYHYSPMLQQYFEVSDILKMIKKELIGEVLASSDK